MELLVVVVFDDDDRLTPSEVQEREASRRRKRHRRRILVVRRHVHETNAPLARERHARIDREPVTVDGHEAAGGYAALKLDGAFRELGPDGRRDGRRIDAKARATRNPQRQRDTRRRTPNAHLRRGGGYLGRTAGPGRDPPLGDELAI